VFILETVAAYLVVANYQGLTNSYMTDEERENVDLSSKEAYNRVAGSKIQIIGWSFYVAILWLVKFSLSVFYSRLTCVPHISLKSLRKIETLTKLQNRPSNPPDTRPNCLCYPWRDVGCNTIGSPAIVSAFPSILANQPRSRQ
jgi:hypothetical protein